MARKQKHAQLDMRFLSLEQHDYIGFPRYTHKLHVKSVKLQGFRGVCVYIYIIIYNICVFCLLWFYVDVQCFILGFECFVCEGFSGDFDANVRCLDVWNILDWKRVGFVEIVRVLCLRFKALPNACSNHCQRLGAVVPLWSCASLPNHTKPMYCPASSPFICFFWHLLRITPKNGNYFFTLFYHFCA